MEKTKRICIVGAGAVGGVIAAVLMREKYKVTLVTKYNELAGKISKEGLQVKGNCGTFKICVPSVASPAELQGKFDFVLLATKAMALPRVAEAMIPYLHDASRVVSLQNGICEEMLAGIVGEERTVGCVVAWGGTLHEPGSVEMTSEGEFILGNWNRARDEKLAELADIMGHIVPVRTSDQILPELYSKLIINACITTLGAVCGLYLGEMLARRSVRNLFIEVIREAVRVADAMGLNIPPAANGKLDYYKFLAPGILSKPKRHLTIRVIGMKYRKLKSSSLQSLERGQKTEVENYNGYVSAKGREFSVQTPVNDQLLVLIREIEKGSRTVSPDNFREINLS